jgi:hypothetical protein
LTNATPWIERETRDRPDVNSSVPEVTPGMISAGLTVLEDHLESYFYSTLVEVVYIAMSVDFH